MQKWRRCAVVCLMVCLFYLPLADLGCAGTENAPPDAFLTKQRVGQLGVGAKVKIELTDGSELQGSIQSIDEHAFYLAPDPSGSLSRVTYEQVAHLKGVKITYNAKGKPPDATEVKRVAAALGVGHHIVVKTSDSKEFHGNILVLDTDSFTMLPDQATSPVQIAYSQTVQMGPNLSKASKIAIIALVAVAVVVAAIAIHFAENIH